MGSGYLNAPRGAVDERVVSVNGEDIVQYAVDNVHGATRVQLFDARTGRIVDQQDQSNFISRMWGFCARGWQRMGWAAYPINPITDIETIVSDLQVGRPPMLFPNHCIAAWNDASAEDPMTEHRIETDSQGLVAWASRNPVGSPIYKRGIVNVSDSYWTDRIENQVYDWPTTAGNGTFRSVGYTTCVINEGFGRFHIRPSYADRRWFSSSGDLRSTVWGVTTDTFVPGSGKIDTGGDLVIPVRRFQVGSTFGVMKIAAASLVYAGLSPNAAGASERAVTPTVPFSTSSAFATNTNSSATSLIHFIGEQGGFYWFTGPTASNSQLVRVHKSTGVGDRQVTNTAFNQGSLNSTQAPGCIIGSNAFIFGAGNNPSLFRYDLTANPPTLTATITPSYPSLPGVGGVLSCDTDGTDIILNHSTCGIIKINTSGAMVQEYGYIQEGNQYENGSAPYSGTAASPGSSIYELFRMDRYQTGGGSTYPPYNSSTSLMPTYRGRQWNAGCVIWFENDLHWMVYPFSNAIGSSVVSGLMQMGWNMGSRSLLASDVTKTSGNTMKITYTITLPDII